MSDSEPVPTYAFEGFRVDPRRRLLSRASGETISLPPKVFDTLLYLVERRGELLDKRRLLEAIWPNVVVEENNLNQSISALRRVLGERPGEHRFIVTEPGRGYRFVAPVAVVGMGAAASAEPDPGSGGVGASPTATSSRSPTSIKKVRVALVAGMAAAAISAIALVLIRHGPSEPKAPAAAGAPASLSASRAGAGADDRLASPGPLPNSVAVLPLENLSTDADEAYVAVGMHAEIINQLTKLRNLTVISRDAVLRYADPARRPGLDEIARELNVGSILSGTVQYANGQIRVDVQLVDPGSGRNLWAGDYQSKFTDAFSVQADIATNVADALSAEFSAEEQQQLEKQPTGSAEAYATYLRALSARYTSGRPEALRLFQRATEIDPRFALAYAQLALLYARSLIDWLGAPAVPLDAEEIERRARENAERALSLDPHAAVAHTALAQLDLYFWRWTEATAEHASAYALSPKDTDVLAFDALADTFQGKHADAIALSKRLVTLNPVSLDNLWVAYVYSGDVDEALKVLGRQLAIDPHNVKARLNMGFMHVRRRRFAEAESAFRLVEQMRNGLGPTGTANLAHAYAQIGRPADARRLFDEIERMSGRQDVGAGAWAMAYLAIGDEARALQWLDRALEKIGNHEPDTGWFSLMIMKHNVTGDPVLEKARFKARRDKIRGS